MAKPDDELATEALRVYRRYAREMVEGLNLCPYAEQAKKSGQVVERVILEREPTYETARAALDELVASEAIDIGLLIYPRVQLGRSGFDRFVSDFQARDQASRELGKVPFAMAAFHPQAPADTTAAERLVPFIRRTPDPTIQLVRRAALDRVRGGGDGTQFLDPTADLEQLLKSKPSLRKRIASANLATVQELTVDHVARLFDDILRDRNDAYARFGEPPRLAPPSAVKDRAHRAV